MTEHTWSIIQQVAIIAIAVAVIMQAIKQVFKLKDKKLRKTKEIRRGKMIIQKEEFKQHWLLRFYPVITLIVGAGIGFLYNKFKIDGIVYGIAGGGLSTWIYALVKKTLQGK